jgi:hypothetical protein
MVTLVCSLLSSRWDGRSVTIFFPGTDLSCWPVAIHLSSIFRFQLIFKIVLASQIDLHLFLGRWKTMAPLAPGAVNSHRQTDEVKQSLTNEDGAMV